MFNLINKSNGNWIGIKNGEICEIDMGNFRYNLDGPNVSDGVTLEYKLFTALMIMLKNRNVQMKLQYLGYWSLKYFFKSFFRNLYYNTKSNLLNKYSNERIYYHWVSQSDFIKICQMYQAWHLGKIPTVYIGINSLKKSLKDSPKTVNEIKVGDTASYLGIKTQVAKFFTDGYMFGVDHSIE